MEPDLGSHYLERAPGSDQLKKKVFRINVGAEIYEYLLGSLL